MVGAQNEQDRDDRGFLTALLEDNLSDAGREVRIIGFTGALSSRATIEELTIADDDGIWITLKNVVLDWNRSALIGGHLEVNALTAELIELPRFPVSQASGPSSQAIEFSLPDLPVSVDIADVRADRVVLGEPVLGRPVQVDLHGSLFLDSGIADAKLSIERTDNRRGSLELETAYNEADGQLLVSLTLSEEKDGIAAELLDLPGRPDVEMTIAGNGPVTDFSADINLATDGLDRLAGQVTLSQPGDTRRLAARISGDITSLFAPDHQEFFGPDVALTMLAWREPDGTTRLEELSLDAANLSLTGSGTIGANGWPDHFSISAKVRNADGSPVLLPLAGPKTRVKFTAFDLNYDRSEGDGWTGRLLATELERQGSSIDILGLSGNGQIDRGGTEGIGGVTGVIKFETTGISFSSLAFSQAAGSRINGKTKFSWLQGNPISVDTLEITGEDLNLAGNATVSGLSDNLEINGHVQIHSADLARFSGLAGIELGGAGELDIGGKYTPLGGAFDLVIAATTEDLRTGQVELDRLLQGSGKLNIKITRDIQKTTLRQFDLITPEIRAEASGNLSPDDGEITSTVRLANLGVLIAGLDGPVDLDATASQRGSNWEMSVNGNGPASTQVAINGTVATDGTRANLRTTGTTQLALANPFIKPRSLSGEASFDLSLTGPLALSALSGNVNASNARMVSPDVRLSLTDMTMSAAIKGEQASVNLSGGVSSGGRFVANGPISLLAPNDALLSVGLRNLHIVDPELFETTLGGNLTVEGPLAGGARISGWLTLSRTEIAVPSSGFTEFGSLPALVHINEPADVRATRERAGLLASQSSPAISGPVYPLDLTINAPERIFVRGRGLDAELGGQLRLGGTTADVQPAGRFELIRGRLDILGKRLDLTEGMIQMRGELTPFIRFVATTQADAVTISVTVEGQANDPVVTFSSQPELPEDEVLSQMLFNRSITQISPFQAAQLAAAVATLAGKGGGGVVDRLRQDFGLDDLDITTNETGSTGVRVGKYISDNVYTDIEVDSDGTSQINLNMQLSPSLVIKGGTGSDGNTGIGIFVEKDY